MSIKKSRCILMVLAAAVFAFSSSAHSLGENEKDILQFFGGVYLIEKVTGQLQQESKPTFRDNRGYQQDLLQDAYDQGVRDRERERLERARQRAYECGYNGTC